MTHTWNRVKRIDGLVYDRHPYGPSPARDPSLIVRGLEPATEFERLGMSKLSAIDVELLLHKMTSIVEEAREVYSALSISEGIITGDMNCAIFTAEGDPAVVATGIFFHALLNYSQVKFILARYKNDPTVGLKPGDVYFFNDPTAGGVHTFDMFVTTPIFQDGELIAWAEVGGHQGECGSVSPGGFAPKATSRWEEGLHVHALKIGENFQLRTDILDFLQNSVRNPFVLAADLKARLATCRRITERVGREAERRGAAVVAGGLRAFLDLSANLARARLREIHDGAYRSILFNDTVGGDEGLTRIPCTVIKEDDHLTVVVQGVSPENRKGPMHATWHLMRASLAVYLFSYLFRGIPPNAGLLEPIHCLFEGPSIANSSDDCAHGEGTSISGAALQSLHVIGAKMLFSTKFRESVSAPHARNVQVETFSGKNAFGYDVMNWTGIPNAAGQGARFDMDGLDACGFYWGPLTDAGEVEETEGRLPLVILSRLLDKDGHGYGKYRGGTPLVEISMAPPQGCSMTSWGSSDRISQSPGVFGGYSGPPNPRFVVRDTDLVDLLSQSNPSAVLTQYEVAKNRPLRGEYLVGPSSVATEAFVHGDVFINNLGAGGGYGDVLEREPSSVLNDVRAGVLSARAALRVYKVVLTDDVVDAAATERLRNEERDARRRRGKPFDQFIDGWLARQPSPKLLKYYGHFPEPRVPNYRNRFWGLYDE